MLIIFCCKWASQRSIRIFTLLQRTSTKINIILNQMLWQGRYVSTNHSVIFLNNSTGNNSSWINPKKASLIWQEEAEINWYFTKSWRYAKTLGITLQATQHERANTLHQLWRVEKGYIRNALWEMHQWIYLGKGIFKWICTLELYTADNDYKGGTIHRIAIKGKWKNCSAQSCRMNMTLCVYRRYLDPKVLPLSSKREFVFTAFIGT